MATNDDGSIGVPMTIKGQTFNMLLDTGGSGSMMTESTAAKLGLTSFFSWKMRGMFFGGRRVERATTAYDIDFGGLKANLLNFYVIPDSYLPAGVDGLLGPEIPHAFDDDFDFANARLNLFSPHPCAGKAVYWTKNPPFAIIPMKLDEQGHINIPIVLDGKPIKAVLDTGAPVSYVSFEVARKLFGLDPKSPALKLAGWSHFPKAVRYPFKTLTIEGITVNNPEVVLVPDDESVIGGGNLQALLGMNVLRFIHLYIAYKERVVYVTPASAH